MADEHAGGARDGEDGVLVGVRAGREDTLGQAGDGGAGEQQVLEAGLVVGGRGGSPADRAGGVGVCAVRGARSGVGLRGLLRWVGGAGRGGAGCGGRAGRPGGFARGRHELCVRWVVVVVAEVWLSLLGGLRSWLDV